ncbi:MAG: DUF892 family protein [Bacteroidales bacterium]|nr:DUF892 family protein [Bacteroidales bacterium]
METSTYPKTKIYNTRLEKFFVEELKEIYGAERYFQNSLGKMRDAATNKKLIKVLNDQKRVTIDQMSRLEDAFRCLGKRIEFLRCEVMENLVKQTWYSIEKTAGNSKAMDVALIHSCHKIRHFEVAAYHGLISMAETLDYCKIKQLLNETLQEDKEAVEMFSLLPKWEITYQSAN